MRLTPWAKYVTKLTLARETLDYTEAYAALAAAYGGTADLGLDKDRIVTYNFSVS